MKPNKYLMQGFRSPLFNQDGKSKQRLSLAERARIEERRRHVRQYDDSKVVRSYSSGSTPYQRHKDSVAANSTAGMQPATNSGGRAVDIVNRQASQQSVEAVKPTSRFVEPPSRWRS